MVISRFIGKAALAIIVLSNAQAALAEDASVYVATSNNEISEVDFPNMVAVPVVSVGGQNFSDIALREDETIREVIAASSTQQSAVLVFDVPSTSPKWVIPYSSVAGVAVSPNGDVFFTTGSASSGDDERVLVAARAGGQLQPVTVIDASVRPGGVKIAELTDVEYVTTTSPPDKTFAPGKLLSAGDILVLSKSPATLFRYCGGDIEALLGREVHACRDTDGDPTDVVVDTAAFGGAEPVGVTFAPDGTILVSTRASRVLHFDLDGTPLPDFVTLPANGGRIDAAPAPDGANGEVVVALQSGGVARYAYPAPGPGTFVTSGISSTGGVAIQAGNAAFTPAVPGVTISLQSITAQFENPLKAGSTASNCITFVDPREDAGTLSQPDVALDAIALDSIPEIAAFIDRLTFEVEVPVLPGFVRGFPRQPGGQPVLRMCAVDTSVEFLGLIDIDSNEFPWLGYKPLCKPDAANPVVPSYMKPRFFYAEDTAPQIYEGNTFINLTTVCNRDGSESWRWKSIFITGAREIRSTVTPDAVAEAVCSSASSGVLNCQLNSLEGVLADFAAAGGGDRKTQRQLGSLTSKLTSVIRRFDRGQYCRAKSDLVSFQDLVAQAKASGLLPELEIAELSSRAKAALFSFGLPEVCP